MIDRKVAKAFISHLLENADEVEVEQVINAMIDLRDLKRLMKGLNLDLSSLKSKIEQNLYNKIDYIAQLKGEANEDEGVVET